MLIGSLFSGIGGLELGLEWAGLGHTVWQVEQDEYCKTILSRHWPHALRFENVLSVGKENLRPVDIICGGFPCQDNSSAGKGRGLAGKRSGLWFQFARVVEETRPRWVIVENVASGAKRWVDHVCAQLGEFGYEVLPLPISAEDVRAPHLRRRVFVIATDENRGFVSAEPSKALAHRRGDRRSQQWEADKSVQSIQYNESGTLVDRCYAPLDFPPRPGDVQGWIDWTRKGRPQPGILRSTHGLPAKLARDRIRVLGNAVVPQCAEVAGWAVRLIEETEGQQQQWATRR